MHKPISVVTINWNNLKGLQRTLESVFAQTARKSIELIVVDGGSTDGSKDYMEQHQSQIEQWVSEKDKGLYDAMNKGIEMAHGDFVWFVNSGDAIYHHEVAEKLLPLIERADVVYGDTMFIDPNGNSLGLISQLKPQPYPKKLTFQSFKYGMNICHQSILVKKSLAPKYDLHWKQAADIDWILQVLKKNPETLDSKMVIAAFETGGSSYQNEKKAWKERYKVLAKHFGAWSNFISHIWIFARRILFNLGIWKHS